MAFTDRLRCCSQLDATWTEKQIICSRKKYDGFIEGNQRAEDGRSHSVRTLTGEETKTSGSRLAAESFQNKSLMIILKMIWHTAIYTQISSDKLKRRKKTDGVQNNTKESVIMRTRDREVGLFIQRGS